MEIHSFDYQTPNGINSRFGVNVEGRKSKPCINLFDLKENKNGAKIGDNIWSIAAHILSMFFDDEYERDKVEWTLSSGHNVTDILFIQDANNKPLKLKLSDPDVFKLEQFGHGFSTENYEKNYSLFAGKAVSDAKLARGIVRERIYEFDEPEPAFKESFAVPCEQAPDGVIYYKPPYIDTPHMRHDFEYIMVDTKKFLERIYDTDPKMRDHARYKNNGTDMERYFKNNSPTDPRETGHCPIQFNSQTGKIDIRFGSGNAGLLAMAEELNLPYLPIAIEKHGPDGPDSALQKKMIRQLESEIGYNPNGNQSHGFRPKAHTL